jgi:hypothetical protein
MVYISAGTIALIVLTVLLLVFLLCIVPKPPKPGSDDGVSDSNHERERVLDLVGIAIDSDMVTGLDWYREIEAGKRFSRLAGEMVPSGHRLPLDWCG